MTDGLQIWAAIATGPNAVPESQQTVAALNQVNNDAQNLQQLLATYELAANGASKTTVWTNIQALTSTMVNDANALLQLSAIKNPQTKQEAIIVIDSINAAVNVIAGMELSAQSKAQVKAAAEARRLQLSEVSRHWSSQDKAMISRQLGVPYSVALAYAEHQGF